jgi:hypothetical protein
MTRPAESAAERQDRLAKIRQQIQAGTYETRERLSAAVDAMLEDFANQLDKTDPLDFASGRDSEPATDSPSRRRRPK